MRVLTRNGQFKTVKLDEITDRIAGQCAGLDPMVDPTEIAVATVKSIHDGITTAELDLISAKIAESRKLDHPDYGKLASRIWVSNLHKSTPARFSECMELIDSELKISSPAHISFIRKWAQQIDSMIIDANDYQFEYLGLQTMAKSYLIKIKRETTVNNRKIFVDQTIDRPQYMWMRVAIGINLVDPNEDPAATLANIRTTYEDLSNMLYTHATPTLFNSCTKMQQLNSCFLCGMGDSIEEIMRTLTNVSIISKWAGGIGVWAHEIRCANSYIGGTNGTSSGLPKQLKLFNDAARCWDQGGKRLGSFAIYISPEHGDIMKVLQMKRQNGKDEERARDLFYAMWIPDLFMKHVAEDLPWYLFSDDTAPGLSDVYDGMPVCTHCGFCRNRNYAKFVLGKAKLDERITKNGHYKRTNDGTADEAQFAKYCQDNANCGGPNGEHNFQPKDVYTELYMRYVEEKRHVNVVRAREILEEIIITLQETGTPYICFKDHVNRKSNQSNIGTVKSSNLCVTPDTYVLTDKGQYKIVDLVGQNVNVWNGVRFQPTVPMKTGENQKIVTVNLSNGVQLECTEYHKFYTQNGKEIARVDASRLRPGDKLIKYNLPNNLSKNCISTQLANYFAENMLVNSESLRKIRLLLQTAGIDSIIGKSQLIISPESWAHLAKFNLPQWVTNVISVGNIPQFVEIVSVEDHGKTSYTYCFNEPERHMGMFNGVLTGNCTEILEWSSEYSYACCTLASLNLPKYLITDRRDTTLSSDPQHNIAKFDFAALHAATKRLVRNLDNVIEVNQYPVVECENNSLQYRPIGIGYQGLADLFHEFRIPFLSPEAAKLDLAIMETIYHGALEASCELAQLRGRYSECEWSPAAQGRLQPDLWVADMRARGKLDGLLAEHGLDSIYSGMYDWDALRAKVAKWGLRNSLLVALMPTVTTSQIFGNCESFEPRSFNLYVKNTLAGQFTVVNARMINHLRELGLWNAKNKNLILRNDGSVQDLDIPAELKEIYQTVFENKQLGIVKRAALRGAFVDQAMSLNIHLTDNADKFYRGLITTAHSLGLKTGSYYIRTRDVVKKIHNVASAVNAANASNAASATNVASASNIEEQVDESKDEPLFCDRSDPTCKACAL